ncbi:MAG: LysM domain-containing protein [Comamonadaceae bacterium]|nr:MAG: LysM domain-containing protein [Comamonadaceae bacterium]
MKKVSLRSSLRPQPAFTGAALASALWLLTASGAAQAQNFPITPQQRATAQQTAQQGVPLSELAPNAPDEYTVKRGDTLWAISRIFLKSPWRWPELWGMNLQEISNPHRIYPGQVLYLDKSNGRARLGMRRGAGGQGVSGGTVKLTPRTRSEAASDLALPTINPNLIEAFLTEPEILDDEAALTLAPRIVAGNDSRVLLTRGDRAYARGPVNAPLLLAADGPLPQLRVFRTAAALKDPGTGEILGYEAQYLGKVRLERGESTETQMQNGTSSTLAVPATVDVVAAREEIRAGDRLLPEPPRQLVSYMPRAPQQEIVGGRIVSVYGNAVSYIGQNQIVTINKGRRDGIESGHVMAILKNGETIIDRTGTAKETLKLPNERAGLLMVFRTFEKASYALVLEISDNPRAGDLLANP